MAMVNTEEWFDQHTNELVEDIYMLVRIPSVSVKTEDPEMPYGPECRRVLDACLKLGESMGFTPFNHENYCGTLLWKGEMEEEIGFFGHADVVPAGEGWTYKPYEPTVENGLIMGRGVADNKGSVLAALYALRYLKENGYKPRHSMRIFFGCSEETNMEDLEYYVAHYKQPVFSVVADYRFPGAYGEKGLLELDAECREESRVLVSFASGVMSNAVPAHAEAVLYVPENWKETKQALKALGAETEEGEEAGTYRVSVEGIPAHAAFPEGSESAEVKLAGILLKAGVLDEGGKRLMTVCSELFEDYYGKGLGIEYSDAESGKLTHVGGMASYEKGVFRQNINIRYSVTADYETLIKQLKERLGQYRFEVTRIHHSGPSYIDPELPVIQKMTEIANRVLKTDLKPVVIGGGTYARKLDRAIAYGMGMPVRRMPFGKTRGGAHQADEYVEIEDLKKAFLIYVEAIQAMDELVSETMI